MLSLTRIVWRLSSLSAPALRCVRDSRTADGCRVSPSRKSEVTVIESDESRTAPSLGRRCGQTRSAAAV